MRLLEFQAKEILARHGIPVPRGSVAATPEDAMRVAEGIGGAVVVKAQVGVGGRGKAGGIVVAADPPSASRVAGQMLGSTLQGLPVRQVLVEQALDIAQELYLGLALDRAGRCLVAMASSEGGVDIEQVAEETPAKIARVSVDPLLGLRDYQVRELANGIALSPTLWPTFLALVRALCQSLVACDATLAEINPLAITREGALVAADAKMVLDGNALYRHPELGLAQERDDRESEAQEHGLSYVGLDGEIGCMVNGAGLAMATMDIIRLHGGSAANFLDIGGGARADKVVAALRLILSEPRVRSVLINIFGGITRCDEVARGILAALESLAPTVPIIVRLVGTNGEEGQRILERARVATASSLSEAVRLAVAAVRNSTPSRQEASA